jgi:hypothetical protein
VCAAAHRAEQGRAGHHRRHAPSTTSRFTCWLRTTLYCPNSCWHLSDTERPAGHTAHAVASRDVTGGNAHAGARCSRCQRQGLRRSVSLPPHARACDVCPGITS